MAGAITSETMLAVVKPEAAAGAEIREVKIPAFGRTDVLVKVKVASICGTDLHIYNWDRWAQNRIHPPLIPGHEFCGEVAAFGAEVTSVKEGDFVSAEMHVACGKCLQCRTGEAHICQNVKIIGVDADGAFAEYVVIPESNIWKLDPAIPQEYASILDPLGNAVHTVLAGEIAAKTVAVTGCGPIGLFAIAVAKAVGATSVFAIEVNEHRARVAREMNADYVLDPAKEDVHAIVMEKTEKERLKLPPDLANGLVLTFLKNLGPDAPPIEVSMLLATPKPRLVKLAISSLPKDPFSLVGSSREALHYSIKVKIGGVEGLVAPWLGKQPPDSHVWILDGESPTFVKSETLSYIGGPIWRTELVAPVWPRSATAESKNAGAEKH